MIRKRLIERLRSEWRRLLDAASRVDKQTAIVLLFAALMVILHAKFGGRRFFRETFDSLAVTSNVRGLLSWGWWFGFQGLTGFVLPVLLLVVVFRRKIKEIGLGLGDWKLALTLGLAYVPLVVVGTWVLSDQTAFQQHYPHFRAATRSWEFFILYHLLFLLYWVGWEYLWRGFVLFGTAGTFGVNAIFVQAMPFAILHMEKPLPEAALSIVGAVALGALVWRCRSFWIAVPIHAVQMLFLDLFCSLRARTGATGLGFDALSEAMGGLF